MKILIFPDAETASRETARRILARVKSMPTAVLGLATGGTMQPVYTALREAHRQGNVSFDAITTFNLDEYIGLGAGHPQSYHQYMQEHLFGAVGLPKDRAHLPRGDAEDPDAEALRYEAQIRSAGGIDLQLLGLGTNGHIGFNEPTSSLTSRTRVKTLTRSTVAANARFFTDGEAVPRFAITMGIGTILDAVEVLLLATGDAKKDAVAHMIEGPLSAACPASALQLHRRTTVLIDEAAATRLRLRDYYETVHPGGTEQ